MLSALDYREWGDDFEPTVLATLCIPVVSFGVVIVHGDGVSCADGRD
jgi:hypothetical protein